MSLPTDYDKLCPIFNWNTKDGGVLFPYVVQLANVVNQNWVELDNADISTILGSFVAPFKCRLITAQAVAVPDATGAKAAAATTEGVIGLVYGTNTPLATCDAGTSCGVITCDGAGTVGKIWSGTTDETTIAAAQEVGVYLKTQCESATSANTQGGAIVVLWFAHVNAP